jgi:prevent-host-death family protein
MPGDGGRTGANLCGPLFLVLNRANLSPFFLGGSILSAANDQPKVMEAVAIYNMHDAKSNLSRLVDQVAAGREVVIAKAGKPVARLVPLSTQVTGKKRKLGLAAGKFSVPEDFDAPLPAELWGDLLARS